MTRILAKLTLAVFLAALASPCGLVPFHGERDAAPATVHGHPVSSHGADAHGPCADRAAAAKVCGTDVALSAVKTDPAFVAVPQSVPQPFLLAAAPETVARARATATSPTGPPPDPNRTVFALTGRLRL